MKSDAGDVTGSLPRAIGLLRQIADLGPQGARLTDIAARIGLPRASAHRLLGVLVSEGMVQFDARQKLYTLGLGLFSLAAKAGSARGLREIGRPTLLKLTEAFDESFFLLVRDGCFAVCIDRSYGRIPARAINEDIGGRILLGRGQGALVILAHLPPREQDEVIRQIIGRLRETTNLDEASLRIRLAEVRTLGYALGSSTSAAVSNGVGVPIFDEFGRAVAALSLASPSDRLVGERQRLLIDALQREARAMTTQLNPFDPVLQHAQAAFD